MQSTRDVLMDNLKGVLILLVVFSHFLLGPLGEGVASPAVQSLTIFVYCFHMPLFVFVSGYFSKDVAKARSNAFARVLVPYLIFDLTMRALVPLWNPGLRTSLLEPLYVYWYLLALFVWRVLLPDLARLRHVLAGSVVAGLLAGFVPGIDNTLAMSRVVGFLPFFLAGFFATPGQLAAVRSQPRRYGVGAFVLAAALAQLATSQHLLGFDSLLMLPYDGTVLSGPLARILSYLLACVASLAVVNLCPDRPLPLLTMAGRNSFLIYVLHRYVTFAFDAALPAEQWSNWSVLAVVPLTAATAFVLGQPVLTRAWEAGLGRLLDVLLVDRRRAPLSRAALWSAMAVLLVANGLLLHAVRNRSEAHEPHADLFPPIVSRQQADDLAHSVSVTFVGDMILLEDQVKLAAKGADHDFAPVFQYTTELLSSADLAIGVLEAPLGGAAAGYSEGNYGDGTRLVVSAPDAWARQARDAGIDLVTTANNHALDRGVDGLRRTLDVLDSLGLAHVGTRRKPDEPSVALKEVGGLRIAVIAYSFGANYHDEAFFAEGREHLLGVLAEPGSPGEQKSRQRVLADLAAARALEPDVIIALPHMGTQFSHESDRFSRFWADFLLDHGVDLVLADHSHAVQPIELRERAGRGDAMVLYSPGNFVNSYLEHDGDAAAAVTVHLSTRAETRGRLVAASVVPMWIRCRLGGLCQPLPIADALRDPQLASSLSEFEGKRIADVQALVTRTMLGVALNLHQLQDRYFLFPGLGYTRQPLRRSETLAEPEPVDAARRALGELLAKSKKTLVIGDSISEGSRNGGYGWYEPWSALFPNIEFVSSSRGGDTTRRVLDRLDKIPVEGADLVILAVGVNDVRYRDEAQCAMDEAAYVANMDAIVQGLRRRNDRAAVVLVAPWPAFHNDVFSKLDEPARNATIASYGQALARYAAEHGYPFLDANPLLIDFLARHVSRDYLVDHIHPNADRGVRLYADAVRLGVLR